eukprot:5718671-Prorocentrum_lima.AAC.1
MYKIPATLNPEAVDYLPYVRASTNMEVAAKQGLPFRGRKNSMSSSAGYEHALLHTGNGNVMKAVDPMIKGEAACKDGVRASPKHNPHDVNVCAEICH